MEVTTLWIGNTSGLPVVQDDVAPFSDPGPHTQSNFVRIGVPIIAIIGVIIFFILAYLAAFYLPDTRLFKYVSDVLNCQRKEEQPEDRQTFLKKRRNSLVKRLKEYRATAKKYPRTEEEPEEAIEYATPYPEALPSNTSQETVPVPPSRRYIPPAAAAASFVNSPADNEMRIDTERDVRRPRPVAYVRPVRPRVEQDVFVVKVPSLNNVNKEVIADIHQPVIESKSNQKNLTGMPDLAGLCTSNIYTNKAYQSLDSGLEESPFISSEPLRISTPRSPLIEGLTVDKSKAYYNKSLSMQNLNLGLGGAKPKTSSYSRLNRQVYENDAYERDAGSTTRRAQSVSDITLAGPLAASKDICV